MEAEADDQDVMSYYVNAYGPKLNEFVDNSQVVHIEAARRGYGPCTMTWAKAVVFSKD